jgi:hypothetical protein
MEMKPKPTTNPHDEETMENERIKLTHAALDDDETGQIILRGVIDPASLGYLKVDDYQREVLPPSRIKNLALAIQANSVPDIDLGMRGGSYDNDNEVFYLKNPTYIIDGLQRVAAARQLINTGVQPRLGALIHFNTTKEWERERFKMLNVSRVKLSPSVLLRNLRPVNPAIDMLFNLCLDSKFALYNKVSWQQRMSRDQLLGALGLLKVASRIHLRFGMQLSQSNYEKLAYAFDKLVKRAGRTTVRDNIKVFWDIVDECWGVRMVAFKEQAPQLKGNFLAALTEVIGSHVDFWDDNKLVMPADLRKKMTQFPITDPQVQQLAGSGGSSRKILYELMLRHLNSGKRTRRLKLFRIETPLEEVEGEEAPSEEPLRSHDQVQGD